MLLTERYADQIKLVLTSFDRVVLVGTPPDFGHAQAATRELYRRHIRIFDFPKFANGIREAIRAHVETLAAESELSIEFVRKADIRKEDVVAKVLARRGTEPGLFQDDQVLAGLPREVRGFSHGNQWCAHFFPKYNFEHRHSGIAHLTPAAVYFGEAAEILASVHPEST